MKLGQRLHGGNAVYHGRDLAVGVGDPHELGIVELGDRLLLVAVAGRAEWHAVVDDLVGQLVTEEEVAAVGLGYPEVIQLDTVAVRTAQRAPAVVEPHQRRPPLSFVEALVGVAPGIVAPLDHVGIRVS